MVQGLEGKGLQAGFRRCSTDMGISGVIVLL
jgi:hypothetical protein